MRTSPRRPLILKRRKLALPCGNESSSPARDEPDGRGKGAAKQEQGRGEEARDRVECDTQKFPAGIKIINHPTMPNTQVVVIPANADIQSIIEALTAKGKESGSNGPNKFILISSGSTSRSPGARAGQQQLSDEPSTAAKGAGSWGKKNVGQKEKRGGSAIASSGSSGSPGGARDNSGSGEATSGGLDNSLTNIQWLGKMSSDGLSSCNVKREMENENQTPKQEGIKCEEDSVASSSATLWQESISERPPYSYMAMIQFAINSTERKRMTLKDIYTWIEDNFPYFKHVAKPGCKNSIRHNLSLHDMFVRETSANGKISFWTIHPDANRYLTLDQVFKVSQQKRHTLELQKNPGGVSARKTEPQSARRKMKPLLPRVNSYLVPIQFPMTQSIVLHSSVPMTQGASLNSSETVQSNKQVRIAPKVSISPRASPGFLSLLWLPLPSSFQCRQDSPAFTNVSCLVRESDSLFPAPSVRQKRQFTALKSPLRGVSDTLVIKRRESREMGRSRRKQHLALPCSEEPVLVLPESSGSDSFKLEAQDLPFLPETQRLGNVSQLSCSQEEGGPFKTPIKEMFYKLLVSSTPNKAPPATPPLGGADPWRLAPLAKERSVLDFSPVRTPQVPFPSLQENLGFNSTSFIQSPFESPRQLLNTEVNDMVSGPLTSSPASNSTSSKQASPELAASGLPENRSLMEGLVLDTMNDSLSKILLDISFPGFEDDNLGIDICWPEFKNEQYE
uniref:Forkhead box protein M1 n=1 Tax=Sphenodon punctatus TaxID=8508 RepID=A0A8D0HP21_SPHPU